MNKLYSISARYCLVFLLALEYFWRGDTSLIYKAASPITYFLSFSSIKVFYPYATIEGNVIHLSSLNLLLVPACIAGAAYFLFIALNLITPMQIKTRINSLIFTLLIFLLLNVLRITSFSILAMNNFDLFTTYHSTSWYLGSTLMVILIWFVNIRLFKIKNIPFYSDLKALS